MAPKYEIRCECGQPIQVQARQAGEAIQCGCGRTIDVPTLRGLAQLPQVHGPEALGRRWTRTQGRLFLAGVVWLAAGSVATWLLWSHATRPVEVQKFDRIAEDFSAHIDRLTPSESFTYWRMFRDQPTGMLTSEERIRQAGTGNSQFVWLAWAAGATTLIGVSIIGYGLVRRRSGNSSAG